MACSVLERDPMSEQMYTPLDYRYMVPRNDIILRLRAIRKERSILALHGKDTKALLVEEATLRWVVGDLSLAERKTVGDKQ